MSILSREKYSLGFVPYSYLFQCLLSRWIFDGAGASVRAAGGRRADLPLDARAGLPRERPGVPRRLQAPRGGPAGVGGPRAGAAVPDVPEEIVLAFFV